MGRVYKPNPHGKRYRKPNPTDLAAAVKCVISRQMSCREASKEYGVHYSVIYRHVKNPDKLY